MPEIPGRTDTAGEAAAHRDDRNVIAGVHGGTMRAPGHFAGGRLPAALAELLR